tara:strand:- start:773 stop:949 length:177 start_codon:yes stop_codon:yes gene_type:complete
MIFVGCFPTIRREHLKGVTLACRELWCGLPPTDSFARAGGSIAASGSRTTIVFSSTEV